MPISGGGIGTPISGVTPGATPLYCTAEEVKAFNQDTEMVDAILDLLIPAVSDAINRHCRTSFQPIAAARPYDYAFAREVRLREPLLTLEEVATNAGQIFTANDFIFEPYSGPPFHKLRLKRSVGLFNWAGSVEQAITVVGEWGWFVEPPSGVKLGTILWVSDLYATADVRGLSSVGGGGIKAAIRQLGEEPPDDVKAVLPAPIVRIEALGNG